jgi:hypothetical protein
MAMTDALLRPINTFCVYLTAFCDRCQSTTHPREHLAPEHEDCVQLAVPRNRQTCRWANRNMTPVCLPHPSPLLKYTAPMPCNPRVHLASPDPRSSAGVDAGVCFSRLLIPYATGMSSMHGIGVGIGVGVGRARPLASGAPCDAVAFAHAARA